MFYKLVAHIVAELYDFISNLIVAPRGRKSFFFWHHTLNFVPFATRSFYCISGFKRSFWVIIIVVIVGDWPGFRKTRILSGMLAKVIRHLQEGDEPKKLDK